MQNANLLRMVTATGLGAVLIAGTMGCKELPGSPGQQGAAMGGLGGAAAGAAVAGSHHRVLGALLGGALGAGGGYLIGANSDRLTHHDTAAAQEAERRAQSSPATPEQARTAPTADLNGDGFVTMDEVVAMKQAGLSDQQMVDKLRATNQTFELTPQQQDYLRTRGVDQFVIDQMLQMNHYTGGSVTPPAGGVISSPPPAPAPVPATPPPPARY